MQKKIFFYFVLFACSTFFLNANDSSWESFKYEIFQELPLITGWCDKEKAEKLMDFIYESKPAICVEIGTFGGSTTYPIARALQYCGQGVLYTIDAWDNKACVEGLDPSDSNYSTWSNLNLNDIREQFILLLFRKELINWCYPIYMRSEQSDVLFEDNSIDFLYIDGNFSKQGTMQDVIAYYPKVKDGGYIWINDADTIAKNKSVAFLMKNCIWIKEKSLGKRCVLFKKKNT